MADDTLALFKISEENRAEFERLLATAGNMYDMLRDGARIGGPMAIIFTGLNETLDHFKIVGENRRAVGDLIQRWSMALAEHGPMRLNMDDPGTHALADMVEWFQKRTEDILSGK